MCHLVIGSDSFLQKKYFLIYIFYFFVKKIPITNDKVTRVNSGTHVTLSLALGFFYKKYIYFKKIYKKKSQSQWQGETCLGVNFFLNPNGKGDTSPNCTRPFIWIVFVVNALEKIEQRYIT